MFKLQTIFRYLTGQAFTLYIDSGGGGSSGGGTSVQDLPEWAKPYAKNALEKSAALSEKPYQAYEGPRISGFSPMQLQSQQAAANMAPSAATGAGIDVAAEVANRGLGAAYQPGQFQNQFQAPDQYQAGRFGARSIRAPQLQQYQMGPAQQVQAPELQQYQMGPAERVGTDSFTRTGTAEGYMSPYMQNVVDIQQREARRASDIARQGQQAQAVGAGAFGGSRQALVEAERQRNLATQLGDIQSTGQQAAFQNAQQQFNAEQARQLQAQQANQQAGLTTGLQNLNALLGIQQLGAGQNLQSQLANQQAGLTTGQQNLAALLGVQNLGAQQGLQAQQLNQAAQLQAQQLGEQSRQFGYGKGLEAAGLGAQYGQAAQQLGEQSRQYGAGYGLQGLQTALQGAGQLGALGGQEFQQGMDINKLQNAYGGQQQALRQQGMDLAYQDFLNEQNYPYKQLGFFSDMIRGLPLGQVTTQQMYQAPGSVAGQVAGLGVGALGLSKFMAEGGLAYADGGSVDAPDNVERIVSKLSDAQLQQAMKAAQARGDTDQLEAIQNELAMRASERNGMAGAFNQLPQGTQDQMFTAANGGIVAFSEGGYFQDPMGAPSYERSDYSPFKQNIREGEEYTPGLLGMLFGYNRLPAEKQAEAAPATEAKFDRSTATRKEDYAGKASPKPQVPSGSISSIAKKVAATTGAPEEDFMATYRKLRDEARAESKEEMKGLNEDVAKLAGRSKEIRDQGLARALAEFGFGMAAAASKPGARFIGSAAQASPTLAASAARTQELASAADENAMRMRMTMKQYEIAQRKGDNQTASQMAAQMRMLQQTEKQLALKRDELAQQGAYQQGMLGIQRADLARKERGDVVRGLSAKAQQDAANARMAGEVRKATLDFENTYGRSLRKQLEEQYGPTKGEYMYNQRKKAYVNDALQVGKDQRADANTGVQQVFDLLNRED